MNDQNTETAVAIRHSNTAVGEAMSIDAILDQVRLIQTVMGRVMQEGEHYGTIPGCGERKTLLQPGAQKLCMTFRLAPDYALQETNLDRSHKEYRVVCSLRSITSGTFVGSGVGVCSTMESKYRYKGGSRKCPNCGKDSIIKGRAEYGGGWLCFAKKGGCGSKWADGDAVIEGQSVERVEHDNPADFYNTVLKMAKKRAFVDATITATAASDIFTQDIGDPESDAGDPQPNAPQPTTPRAAQATASPDAGKAPRQAPKAPEGIATVSPETLVWLEKCKAELIRRANTTVPWAWWQYAVDQGWILDTERLEDCNATKMFPEATKAAVEAAFLEAARVAQEYAEEGEGELQQASQAAWAKANSEAPSKPLPEPPKAKAPEKPIEVPRDRDAGQVGEWWREVAIHFGQSKGEKLGGMDKNRLYGWAMNWKPKPYKGKISEQDEQLEKALLAVREHYGFEEK